MACVELPKDAEGRDIPLDTSELFIADGTKVQALRFEYMYHTSDARDAWSVYIERTPGEHMTLHTSDVRLTPLDSWEKLEEDLDKCISGNSICRYYSPSGSCEDCTIDQSNERGGCEELVFNDIKKRIRKLRGEDE